MGAVGSKQFFLVRGKGTDSVAPPFYATENGGVATFGGQLHTSSERHTLRCFPSKSAAVEFIREYEKRPPGTKQAIFLVAEPAPPELQAYFETIEANPRLRDYPLLHLVEQLMNTFDFAHLHNVIKSIRSPHANSECLKSIKTLKTTAHDLLVSIAEAAENAKRHEYRDVIEEGRSGGFHAWYDGEELNLSFELESTGARMGELGLAESSPERAGPLSGKNRKHDRSSFRR